MKCDMNSLNLYGPCTDDAPCCLFYTCVIDEECHWPVYPGTDDSPSLDGENHAFVSAAPVFHE